VSGKDGQPKRLGDLARAAGDVLLDTGGAEDMLVHGLAYDDRPVCRGDLFFCVSGSVDGHDFAPDAVEAGATALCVERPTGTGVPEVVVSDARCAMARISAAFYDHPARGLLLLGVTGTSGKTTTTFLLEAILRAAGHKPGLIGTLGAWVDGERRADVRASPITPPTLHKLLAAMRPHGVDSVAMEVTSHALALRRLEGLRFAAVGFTNLSRDHLDFHGSFEAYFAAKRALFSPQRANRGAVNLDDSYGRALLEGAGVPCVGFGCSPGAQVRAEGVRLEEWGSRFVLVSDGPELPLGRVDVSISLVGSFNVSNCLAAAAIALQAGIGLEAVADGVSRVTPVRGRFEALECGQPFSVVVDYAHNPGSLETVLREARRLADPHDGRVICVFGCGGDTDRGKRPLMGTVAAELAQRVIVTSDNPRSEDPQAIIEDILTGMKGSRNGRVDARLDRGEAIASALGEARPGDVVLIAGRGHETHQQLRAEAVALDDRNEARRALSALGWSGSAWA
jgi:UDP-N-acetylmuramoyl-L-alanyl-D-glutamate--2,6-diaminopimelate ligase